MLLVAIVVTYTRLDPVHLGHHHGFAGTLLVLSALLLSRPRLCPGRLEHVTRAYVSLAFAYGAVNLAEDLWHEQVVKRGWVEWKIPLRAPTRAHAGLARHPGARVGSCACAATRGEDGTGADVDSSPCRRETSSPSR